MKLRFRHDGRSSSPNSSSNSSGSGASVVVVVALVVDGRLVGRFDGRPGRDGRVGRAVVGSGSSSSSSISSSTGAAVVVVVFGGFGRRLGFDGRFVVVCSGITSSGGCSAGTETLKINIQFILPISITRSWLTHLQVLPKCTCSLSPDIHATLD